MNILLTGPTFHSYSQSIANAFRSLGHKVDILDYPNFDTTVLNFLYREYYSKPLGKWNESKRLQMFRDDVKSYNRELKNKTDQYDMLLVLKGDIVSGETINAFNEGSSHTILWCYDKASRYPLVRKNARKYDRFYSFEWDDVSYFQKKGINCRYLPMAFDSNKYYHKNLTNKYDIVFIGHLDSRRRRLLETIASEFRNKEIKVWGRNYSPLDPKSAYLYHYKNRNLRKILVNKNIDHNTINNIYNSAKICLNIHHDQSVKSYNPRTVEILGSCSFLLSDYKDEIDDEFGDCCALYNNESELISMIYKYLSNEVEREKLALRGYHKARKYHKFSDRAIVIMDDIENCNIG